MTNKLLSDEELLDKLNELVQKCENTQWVPEQEKYLSDMVDIINTQKRLYAESVEEDLVDFAKDVLGQFGYNGKSGGLSTLEWAESIIKHAESENQVDVV